ncbi:Hydrocephalus-inducing protein [Oopsacas minuta]|uniref:Hydrocephalus-inducing protein n=1 Tax=Oopsacas minuta TaxID=111878 RepID=A0AAV7JL84_9METZ|nr:Hydrocephalus-inducing protein [Oopsacas minuta]
MAASSLLQKSDGLVSFEGVIAMVKRLQAILVSLQKIGSSNSNQADLAAGLYHKILSGKFVISLCFLHKVLAIMNGLSKTMQEYDIKWVNVANEMSAVKRLLLELKTNDIIEHAEELCSTVNIALDYEDPLYVSRRGVTRSTCPREFCESLKAASVPMLLEELERRFSRENTSILAALEDLDASKATYLDYNIIFILVGKFGDCLKIDSALLKTECERAKISIAAGKHTDSELYPNLFKVLATSKTLPGKMQTQRRKATELSYDYIARLTKIAFSEDLWFLSSGLNNEFGLTFSSRSEAGLLSVKNCQRLLRDVRRLDMSTFLIRQKFRENCKEEESCSYTEFSSLLKVLDRVGKEVEDLQWKFRQLAGYHVDSVSQHNARFIFQVKHGEEFGEIVFQNFLTSRLENSRVFWSEIEESIYSLSPELEMIREILLDREDQNCYSQRFDPFSPQLDATSADCLLEDLRDAMASRNAELVEYCLQRLRQLCINNKLTRSAEQLLLSIRLAQDLRSVMTCRDRNKIRIVLERLSSVGLASKLRVLSAEAEALLKRLDELEILKEKVLEMSSSCYAEIRSYSSPPTIVYSVVKALLLLLGVPERELQTWGHCQAQMGGAGKESVKRRISEYQINCLEKATARKAKLLTQRLSFESVIEVSTGCVVLFRWVQAVLAEVLDKE